MLNIQRKPTDIVPRGSLVGSHWLHEFLFALGPPVVCKLASGRNKHQADPTIKKAAWESMTEKVSSTDKREALDWQLARWGMRKKILYCKQQQQSNQQTKHTSNRNANYLSTPYCLMDINGYLRVASKNTTLRGVFQINDMRTKTLKNSTIGSEKRERMYF